MVEEKEPRKQSEFEKQAKGILTSAYDAVQGNLNGLTLNRWACETWFGFVKRSYNLTEKDTQDIGGAISTISMSNNGITKKTSVFFETLQLIFRTSDAREHNRYLVQDKNDGDKTKIISQATKDKDENRYNVISADTPPKSLRNSIAHLHSNGRQLNPVYPVAITFSALAMGTAALIDKALSPKGNHPESSTGAKAVKYALVSPLFLVSRSIEAAGDLTSFAVESSVKLLISGGKTQKNENENKGEEENVFKRVDRSQPVKKTVTQDSNLTIMNRLSISSDVVAHNLQESQHQQVDKLSQTSQHPVNNVSDMLKEPDALPVETDTDKEKEEETQINTHKMGT